MKIIKAHKIRLNPTPEQEQYFWQAAGIARFAYNWGLAEYNKSKAAGEKIQIVGKGDTLKSQFTALKQTIYPWLGEVSSYAYQGAFADLQKSVSNYFDRHKKGLLKPPSGWKSRKDSKPFGWPQFKSKYKDTPSFYQANTCLQFDGHWIKIQKCPGQVNMTEPLRFDGKVMGARISYYATHWWLSIYIEIDHEVPIHNANVVGVDLGVKYLAVTSDGQIFENPKPFISAQRKLARLQRSFARMEKDGKNWLKMKAKIANLHFRVANLRNEASHQMTTQLTRRYGIIGTENLNIRGMTQNRRLSKAINDAAFYEKRRQLEYKAAWSGGIIVPVDRWFPSSKLCNSCGEINADLRLSDREWICSNCGNLNHRDGNAALNIRDETIRILTGPATQGDSLNDPTLTSRGVVG